MSPLQIFFMIPLFQERNLVYSLSRQIQIQKSSNFSFPSVFIKGMKDEVKDDFFCEARQEAFLWKKVSKFSANVIFVSGCKSLLVFW